ncbi:RING-type domain-containing protein [Heracleum sosnowskyi]|uniref:RING-type E3 ubiquitin transferase n=1 Tax=Heracleum sosnowskyi TaxID=360622 RepID=A0AAD8IEP9_9APIA|nr:RING-type domain-containing protein [Heracleum sosnowskyi]
MQGKRPYGGTPLGLASDVLLEEQIADKEMRRIMELVSMIIDHPSFYSASRSSYDQYRDMRLDVDSMSYEELLALEETIGNVSTGLSEDMILKCLSGKRYSCGDQNRVEESCAICLVPMKSPCWKNILARAKSGTGKTAAF